MDKVLIVNPDGSERTAIVEMLAAEQYDTSSTGDLMSALAILASAPPDLLVTIVQPGGFNGLPLVMSGRAHNSRMTALVLHDSAEDARSHQQMPCSAHAVRHATRPADVHEWIRLVADTLALRERRRWTRTILAVTPSFVTAGGRATLLDVSYGGVRLLFTPRRERVLPALLRLELPRMGLLLDVQRIWSHAADPHATVACGAAVAPENLKRTLRWRRLVDALRRAGTVLV